MTEAANLIEKYKGAGSDDPSSSAEFHQKITQLKPEWDKYAATKNFSQLLKLLDVDAPALKTKATLQDSSGLLQACMDGLLIPEDKPVQWLLTLFYDMLREDSSCFSLFEDGLNAQLSVYKPLMTLLGRQELDTYIADKAAWLLTAIIGQAPRFFREDDVVGLLKQVLEPKDKLCTELGVLEAITNLLKSDVFRGLVWRSPGVAECIFKVQPRTDSSPFQYRCVFAIWMLSFDSEITSELKSYAAIKKLKEILTVTRTEKVVRLCLTVLRNFLSHRALCEEIVEEGVLEAVQQLEFEKWRDAELYDDIRDMATQISSEVHEMSNFERYERELKTGTLSWGFIHSTKFWAENVLKFEQNDFRALKMLASLLLHFNTDATTLAVACHDIGEFVAMHPLGKRKVAQLNVKERIMQLMGSTDPAHREVRREALLCCQKIMLNKWQEMDVLPQ
mmetsp:Transcript_42442/g.134835  ORF Transcript_42442/g.134835 Transcript_42442/m.134835 type:complete len:448 (+) Transcript_42442:69-1412(+)